MSSLDKLYLAYFNVKGLFKFYPFNLRTMNQDQDFSAAELANGRWAMIGIIAALGAYATTGNIIPGVF
tara:strand:+ start:440 stop:643 length:204 start_codon:yes stop_codon:yes gene_type:complete